MSFNKIFIVGYLGRDPELKYTPQGKPVCDFTVATSEKRKDTTGEMKEETTWFKVTYWEKLAEVASQYLKKGKQVYIEGRLQAREWTDKEGRVRTSLEVRGTELKLLATRDEGAGSSNTDFSTNAEGDFATNTATPTARKTTGKTSGKASEKESVVGDGAKAKTKTTKPVNEALDESDIPF
ncbi:MAG: single-stranded DNA-binding protein [Acidobacteriota bacterium]